MQVAVVGSRSFSNYGLLSQVLSSLPFPLSSIVSGGAVGADSLAARYAQEKGLPLVVYRPNYGLYGKRAPLVRNHTIVSSAQQVLAFWDGASAGTAHTLSLARQLGVPCLVVPC
jgi:predicted Rossmann fold nucleotide-binding protein DprA/Smf involved in DNA uptake